MSSARRIAGREPVTSWVGLWLTRRWRAARDFGSWGAILLEMKSYALLHQLAETLPAVVVVFCAGLEPQ